MSQASRHPATLEDADLEAACEIRFARRSGPGGQHRNKVETAVVVQHVASGISAEAAEKRSQAENRRAALFRLRLRLAVQLRSESPAAEPSPLWNSRRQGTRMAVSAEHRDFPSLIAEALDALEQHAYAPSAAAQFLAVSTSQLVALLRDHAPALAALNTRRLALGKPPLK